MKQMVELRWTLPLTFGALVMSCFSIFTGHIYSQTSAGVNAVSSAPGVEGRIKLGQRQGTPSGTGDDRAATGVSTASEPADASSLEILIGAGDLVEVSVYGAPDYVKTVRVQSTGDVTLPLVGTVKIGGLTPAQSEELIAKRLAEGNYFENPRVSVLDKEMAGQGISVLGEVQKPGLYQLPGPRKFLDALSAAGGTTPRAGDTATILHRLDLRPAEHVLLTEDPLSTGQNPFVYPGDTVVVSKAGIVYVIGDVHLPGGFVMEDAHMTVLQAIAKAQGLNSTAALDKARLIRKHGAEGGPVETPIALKKLMSAQEPDMDLHPDDILFVPVSGTKAAGKRTMEAIVQAATGIAIYGSRMP